MSGYFPGDMGPARQGGANDPRLGGNLQGQGVAGSQDAQRALWARANGIDLNQPINEFGRMVMGQFNSVVRPWLGAMLASGNPENTVPGLIQAFAREAGGSGQGYNDFIGGSTQAFLGNPTLMNTLNNNPRPEQAAAQLRSIIGLGQSHLDPVFEQIAQDQFNNQYGAYRLRNAAESIGNSSLYDFLSDTPSWSWMVGR